MRNRGRSIPTLRNRLPQALVFVGCLLVAFTTLATQSAQAQTYTVLHYFADGQDGGFPFAGLSIDAAGNLYGTTTEGGNNTACQGGCGTVFKMSQRSSGWTFSPLFLFNQSGGAYPAGRLIFGRDGRLYGTTERGGSGCSSTGCGVVFAMQPPATFCHSVTCYWSEDVLYQFAGGTNDGSEPTGDGVFDQAGNFYGTTFDSGASGVGTVYELSPSGGGWTESVLHNFSGLDGANPYGGLAIDPSGNLYGPTKLGGTCQNCGLVYELTHSGAGWTETVLQNFDGVDGIQPLGGLILDASGNIYGTTDSGGIGAGSGGEIFELTQSGGSWTLDLLYGYPAGRGGPWCDLVMDSSGNIYGTTSQGGIFDAGTIFKLTNSNGNWIQTTLYNFNGNQGSSPHGSLALDANGNLYGTAYGGGMGTGVVWELTP